LAGSLDTLATVLSELGDRQGALAAAREAVEMLAPFFLRYPQAFAPRMVTMVRNHRSRCEEGEEKPDDKLLDPIVAALAALQGDE
jgi:hypothetical protein